MGRLRWLPHVGLEMYMEVPCVVLAVVVEDWLRWLGWIKGVVAVVAPRGFEMYSVVPCTTLAVGG